MDGDYFYSIGFEVDLIAILKILLLFGLGASLQCFILEFTLYCDSSAHLIIYFTFQFRANATIKQND